VGLARATANSAARKCSTSARRCSFSAEWSSLIALTVAPGAFRERLDAPGRDKGAGDQHPAVSRHRHGTPQGVRASIASGGGVAGGTVGPSSTPPRTLAPGRAALVAASTIDETVNFHREPFDCFGQLENLGGEPFDKRCLRDRVISRAVQLAEGQSNLVRNPDNCHTREPTDWSAPRLIVGSPG